MKDKCDFCLKVVMKYVLVALIFILASCVGETDRMTQRLNAIDSLLVKDENDSAYAMFMKIKAEGLADDESRAFYGMLDTEIRLGRDVPIKDYTAIDKSIKYYEAKKDLKKLARAYFDKGVCLFENGDTKAAIACIKKSEDLERRADYPLLRHLICVDMAHINTEAGAYRTALDYAMKALANAEANGNEAWRCLAYNHIVMCYHGLGVKDSMMMYAEKLLLHLDRIKNKTERAVYNTNIGYIFYETGEYYKAEPLLRRAVAILPEPMMQLNLAKVCNAVGKDAEADSLMKECWKNADFNVKAELLQFLGENAEKGKMFEDAADFYRRAKVMRDSAVIKQNTEARLVAQNDYERKSLKEKQDARSVVSAVIAVVTVLSLAVLSIILYRQRMKKVRKTLAYTKRMTERYLAELDELKKTERCNFEKVKELEDKISRQRERLAEMLERGRELCEEILNGGMTAGWSKADFEYAVEYLRAKKPDEVRKIEQEYYNLTSYSTFFLCLGLLGVKPSDAAKVLNVSQGAVRAMRFRLKTKLRKEPEK